jgi:predicted Zn-dependent peptidase
MSVEIFRHSNGLIVASDPMASLESAAVGVWANCGGRCETRPLMGISHMLEHMAFKGTRRRSARDISVEIEKVGGSLNAYTAREQTAFHARVLKEDIALALDLIADILTEPTFAPQELERERQVILQEIGQSRDTPDDIVFDYLQEAAYPDQPIGWPILGDEDSVSHLSRDDLFAYLRTHYFAGNLILSASGAIRHEEVVALVGEKFAALKGGAAEPPVPARYLGGEKRVDEDLEQAHVALGFPGVATGDPDYFVSQVYVTALGGGMSSRLFQEVREKRGLAYAVYAFSQSVRDSGLIGVYAGTGKKEAGEICAVIAGEMEKIATDADEDEVKRAKAQLKAGLLMGLERPGARAESLAVHLFHYGRSIPTEELVAKLEAVSVADVRRFAANVMATSRPARAAVGPLAKLESYATFAKRFGA